MGKEIGLSQLQGFRTQFESPTKRKKIKRDNPNTIAAKQVNEGWSLDFLSDDVMAENKTRILNVMDEYSRKYLFVDAKRTYKAKAISRIFKVHCSHLWLAKIH